MTWSSGGHADERTFLTACVMLSVMTAGAAPRTEPSAPDWWKALDAQRGGTFALDGSDGVELELVEVTPPVENGPFLYFSLRFRGPATPIIDSGTHVITGPAGTQELGLSPLGVAADADGWMYEAAISLPNGGLE